MEKINLSLFKVVLDSSGSIALPKRNRAIWVISGRINICGSDLETADAAYFEQDLVLEVVGNQPASFLCFEVSPAGTPCVSDNGFTQIAGEVVDLDIGDTIIRLDRVTFPPGAVAYRHVHPGPGIRFLIAGALQVRSDHATSMKYPGSAWFEAANAPVQATADQSQVSEFVRVLLLPGSFEGKPTITLLNPEDEEKPRLQTNHRYFDARVVLD